MPVRQMAGPQNMLSEYNGFCAHPFKSLLLNIARVVSTASLTSAEDQTKSKSNPLAHWCLSQLKQAQRLFIGGIIYGPRTLFRKRQCTATKVNMGLSTSCMKKDKSQELTKNTKLFEFWNTTICQCLWECLPSVALTGHRITRSYPRKGWSFQASLYFTDEQTEACWNWSLESGFVNFQDLTH